MTAAVSAAKAEVLGSYLVELPVRLILPIICLLTAAPAVARQQLDTLSPAQAISKVADSSGKPFRALFQFKVRSAAKARAGYYLNSEKDFHSPSNLSVAIKETAMPGLTKKYGDDLKSALVGKTVKLIGQVRQIKVGRTSSAVATQVDVTHAGQILSVS